MAANADITVITPCLNREDTIEATIRSIIEARSQGVDVQYLIIDGGSTDGTLRIVDQYSDEIDAVVADEGKGQYAAINQGMCMATGRVLAWLNADDTYYPWSLATVVSVFNQNPSIRWITGLPTFIDSGGAVCDWADQLAVYPTRLIRRGVYRTSMLGYLQQESMFWLHDLWDEVGGLDTSLNLAADFDLWRRFSARAELVSVAVPLAAFRRREGQRSSAFAAQYDREVMSRIPGRLGLTKVWEAMSRIARWPRALLRSALWMRGPVVFFDESLGRWKLERRLRPLSRRSLAGLLFQWQRRAHG